MEGGYHTHNSAFTFNSPTPFASVLFIFLSKQAGITSKEASFPLGTLPGLDSDPGQQHKLPHFLHLDIVLLVAQPSESEGQTLAPQSQGYSLMTHYNRALVRKPVTLKHNQQQQAQLLPELGSSREHSAKWERRRP